MFFEVVAHLNKGHSIEELNSSLRLISEAVEVTGKAGKLTLEITVKPAAKGNSETMVLTDRIKIEVPSPDRSIAIFYWDPEERKLVRQNPQLKDSLFGDIRKED